MKRNEKASRYSNSRTYEKGKLSVMENAEPANTNQETTKAVGSAKLIPLH
jgi:hypothetical protein